MNLVDFKDLFFEKKESPFIIYHQPQKRCHGQVFCQTKKPGKCVKNSPPFFVFPPFFCWFSSVVWWFFSAQVTHPERSYASLGCCDSALHVLPGLDAAHSNELHRPVGGETQNGGKGLEIGTLHRFWFYDEFVTIYGDWKDFFRWNDSIGLIVWIKNNFSWDPWSTDRIIFPFFFWKFHFFSSLKKLQINFNPCYLA